MKTGAMYENLERRGSGPICPHCTETRSQVLTMKGPIADPAGQLLSLFFVCERCGTTLMDRRRPTSEVRRQGHVGDRRREPLV
jgi:hypothetical protein